MVLFHSQGKGMELCCKNASKKSRYYLKMRIYENLSNSIKKKEIILVTNHYKRAYEIWNILKKCASENKTIS